MTAAPALDYGEFLAAKVAHDSTHGFARHGAPHPILKPHQADLVKWAVRGGRRAIFASFGLGKSVIQLETVRVSDTWADGPAGALITVATLPPDSGQRDGVIL